MQLKRSTKIFLILLGINLLLHVKPLVLAINQQVVNKTTATLSNIPPDYIFLMFPADSTSIYKTEKFLPEEKIRQLTRAVAVEYQELEKGAVEVWEEGFVPSSDLRYLPESNADQYVSGWQKKITFFGYTAGRWSTKGLSNGHQQVTLELRDDKHARSHTYLYETDGKNVFNISPVQIASGLAMAAVFILCLRFLFLTAVIWFIVSRFFKD